MVAWEGIKELNPEEVQDTKLLMVIAPGPGDLFTTTPVRNLEDLQGLEIRATGLSAKWDGESAVKEPKNKGPKPQTPKDVN